MMKARQPAARLGKLPSRSGQFVGQVPTRRTIRRFAGVGKSVVAVKFRKFASNAAIICEQILKFCSLKPSKNKKAQPSEPRFSINSIT
jgi:hypothetical protein